MKVMGKKWDLGNPDFARDVVEFCDWVVDEVKSVERVLRKLNDLEKDYLENCRG